MAPGFTQEDVLAAPLHRSTCAGLILALGSVLVGCDEAAPLTLARCGSDLECGPGKLCEIGECVAKDTVSCVQVEGGEALLQPTPHRLDLDGAATATITLRNIGTCTLTLFEAELESESGRARGSPGATSAPGTSARPGPISCAECGGSELPLEIFPLRERTLHVGFTPTEVGDFEDAIVLLSDDAEYPELRLPIHARFDGVPIPRAAPSMLDFGYSPVGQTVALQVSISNQGTGTAPLILSEVHVEPTTTTAFSLVDPFEGPVTLAPIAKDHSAIHTILVRYHPREVGTHAAELVITTSAPPGSLRVPLRGSSRTPPAIAISPDHIAFGDLALGQSSVRTVTIQNQGGSPLAVHPHLGGPGASTDFSLSPAVLAPIAPGQYSELQVFATATAPRSVNALLLLDSNDPVRPTLTLPVSAVGQPVPGAEVLKIEMTYGNDAHSFFDDDVRNVDMNLENPFGLICGKQDRSPTTWGPFGHPTWLAFGPSEEPERIVLPDAAEDGTFRVMLQYAEDCSSVPTGLVASVLGISVDVLVGYFSGGAVPLDGDRVSQVIKDLCVSRSPASVTVTVYANGEVIQEVPVRLQAKGDYAYAVDIVRSNGVLHVAP